MIMYCNVLSLVQNKAFCRFRYFKQDFVEVWYVFFLSFKYRRK